MIFDTAAVNILETFYQALNESASEEFKNALPDRVFDSFDSAREYPRSQLEGLSEGVSNESDNILVKLSMNGVKKMLSSKASDKSLFTLTTAGRCGSLWEKIWTALRSRTSCAFVSVAFEAAFGDEQWKLGRALPPAGTTT